MKRSCRAVPLVALVTAASLPAQGVPPAQWPPEVRAEYGQRVADCRREGGRVSVDPTLYVRTADFNGDGRPDFLVDNHGITCSTAASLFCAALGCDYTLFASAPGGGYVNAGGFMGEAELITQNGRPLLRVEAGQGPRLWGWNGRELAIVGSGAPGRTPTPVTGPSAAQPYGFVINLTFSPAALAALARQRQSLIIEAWYNGSPVPAHERDSDPTEGLIDLGAETLTIPGQPGHYPVSGARVNRARMSWVRRVEARVSVRNAPAPQRRSADDLNCSMPPVAFPEAHRAPINIHCQLQGEVRH